MDGLGHRMKVTRKTYGKSNAGKVVRGAVCDLKEVEWKIGPIPMLNAKQLRQDTVYGIMGDTQEHFPISIVCTIVMLTECKNDILFCLNFIWMD